MTKLETNEVQVSRNIKSCREKFGKTQEQVAVILGSTKQTYLKVEDNPMTCSINKLNDVSKAIGCNIDEFFLPANFTFSEIKEKEE